MNVSIVGTGYVGLSTGVGFSVKGNKVICVDILEDKLNRINRGDSPIYEPGLEEKLKDSLSRGLFKATTDLEKAVMFTDVTFVSVGTPSKEDGSIDLKFIEEVSRQIGRILKKKEGYHVVVVKSTVVPGTTEDVVLRNIEKESGKKAGEHFGICMNPEFLREGRAMEDFLKPDRIVIGELDKRSGDTVAKLYDNFDTKILRTNIKVAEMIKYTANSFLATKISFSNEIGNMCKKMGIDVYDVMAGVGLDKRISPLFLWAGAGFGGSCFPKDVQALVSKAKTLGTDPHLLEKTLSVNQRQKTMLVDMLENRMDVKGKRVAVLGLAFKPGSDDVREAPSIEIIRKLKEKGASVVVYDPKAAGNMKMFFPNIAYAQTSRDAINGADACLIVTEWSEFRNLTDYDFSKMKEKVIIEGRKALDPNKVHGFEGICW
ncbi:MAG: UDP-glucose/GDP-mannose dehydrogenase family protein [Candidatus Aenigmarchaeota archaeon]|nr:UDP-glucose/GDP-mannose dehydrogenase family protein [Candidatus Aenigmarchaeota archaeon]